MKIGTILKWSEEDNEFRKNGIVAGVEREELALCKVGDWVKDNLGCAQNVRHIKFYPPQKIPTRKRASNAVPVKLSPPEEWIFKRELIVSGATFSSQVWVRLG